MHDAAHGLRTSRTGAQPADGVPWAVALNETAASDEIEVTLLAFAVVDDLVRVSGLVRVLRRPDVRLASVPTLALATLDGPPLALVGAHVMPHGRVLWVSWIYQRPADILVEYDGRIDHFELTYRAGGIVRETAPGPWVFSFRIPGRAQPNGMSQPVSSGGDA